MDVATQQYYGDTSFLLKLLVTKQLKSLNLSYLMRDNAFLKPSVAFELLNAAAVCHSVSKPKF